MSNNNSFQQIQGVLSIGYIFLIILGILNETLYYKQLGIEILSYSSILDVLISPIVKITANTTSIVFFIVILVSVFFFPRYFSNKTEKVWVKKFFKLDESHSNWSKNEFENLFFRTFIFFASMTLIGFYVGTGYGGGSKISKKIEQNKIDYNDRLNFISGESSDVEILGKNSSYIFYLTKENKTVKVTPINGAIKSIEEIK